MRFGCENRENEELQVTYPTVKIWIEMLESLFFCFRIFPYYRNIPRSLKKEPKLYLWDGSQMQDLGHQFENMVACHLLKSLEAWTDTDHGSYRLMYLPDDKHREADFVVCQDNQPVVLIECKLNKSKLSESLVYFGEKFPKIPLVQLAQQPGIHIRGTKYRIVSADSYLSSLV